MKRNFIYLVFVILISTSGIYSQTIDSSLIRVTVKSKILKENRIVDISLPENYKNTKTKYPVLYLLDGLTNYNPVSTSVKLLSNEGLIPQMIIVCIENTDRNRDMTPTHTLKTYYGDEKDFNSTTGSAKSFINFLNTELVNHIDSVYKTSNYRILSGHSFSALATIYALLDTSEMFNAFIAADPSFWWDNGSIIDLTKTFFKQNSFKSEKKVYLGTTVSGSIQQKPLEKYVEYCNTIQTANLSFCRVEYKSETHMTLPLKCNYDGLRFIYKDWLISYEIIKQGRSKVDDFVKQIKKKYDYPIEFDETFLLEQGLYYIGNEELDKAIQTLKLNLEYFPKSIRSNFQIAQAYRFSGDSTTALAYYKKVVEIDPKNNNALNMIKLIEKK